MVGRYCAALAAALHGGNQSEEQANPQQKGNQGPLSSSVQVRGFQNDSMPIGGGRPLLHHPVIRQPGASLACPRKLNSWALERQECRESCGAFPP